LVPLAVSAKSLFNIFDFVHWPLYPDAELDRARDPKIKHQASNARNIGIMRTQIVQKMIDL